MINVTFSIVSHGQWKLTELLLNDLRNLSPKNFEVIVTINIPEDVNISYQYPFPIRFIHNENPKGFGANHNAAYFNAKGDFFAVVNPDIRLPTLDLDILIKLFTNPKVGVIAPQVLNNVGAIEDSVRHFPTVLRLFRRSFLRQRRSDYSWEGSYSEFEVNWAAGMFLLFRSEVFFLVKGFDDVRFFMYLEDVDICKRIWEEGWKVIATNKLKVIHNAQRASRKNIKYFYWHLVSVFRYLSGI